MSLRAVIYCRCSTEEESQKDALITQVAEAKTSVKQNGWLLVDSYIESKSGTTTKGRTEYNRLYEDLQSNKFDVIVIKSQDRLMRNTKDWYLFVDRLTTTNKKLFMYLEQKFYSTDDALITGIKAILAEEYSRELSKKINNMHRNRQRNNGSVIFTNNTYGYKKLPDKSIEIIPEEAEVKKKMYELCAAGFGSRTIATILKNEGVLNRSGKPFTESAILRMIRNPLNKGTAVMNKKRFDFDTKRTFRVPEEEQFFYENKVPAIVSEELWELANRKIDERVDERSFLSTKAKIGRNRGKDLLSGKMYCGICGEPYYRKTYLRYKDKENIYTWKCKTYLETGRNIEGRMNRPQLRKANLEKIEGCDNVHLDEQTLYSFLQTVTEEHYTADKEQIINEMVMLLNSVLEEKSVFPYIEQEQKKKEQILKQMNVLVDKLLSGVLADDIYKRKQEELQAKLNKVETKLNKLQEDAKGTAIKERISQIEKYLREGSIVDKATTAGMLEDVEKILIFPTYMEIHFSISKLLGLEIHEIEMADSSNVLHIDYGNLFNYRKKKQEERLIILDWMKENHQITAKMIAKRLGISLSGANYKLKALKREGRIYFEGKGGRGKWIVKDDGEKLQ